MVCEETYLSPIYIISNYYVLQKINPLNVFSLGKIINGNVNVVCYYSKDVLPPCLWYISQNDYNKLSPLNTPMKEHDNIMDKSN